MIVIKYLTDVTRSRTFRSALLSSETGATCDRGACVRRSTGARGLLHRAHHEGAQNGRSQPTPLRVLRAAAIPTEGIVALGFILFFSSNKCLIRCPLP